MKRIAVILVCLGLFVCVHAQTDSLSVAERNALQGFNDTIDRLAPDFVEVGLVISEPGEILYSVLGHACLHLQCPTFGLDYFFTYESEGVEGKVFRFLMNDLNMGMMSLSMDEYLQAYIEEGRGVREYRLNLPTEVKSELWRMCDERVAQGMNLVYDPIKRGCAISVVHSVEDAIQSANQMTGSQYHIEYPEWGKPFDRTLREIFYDNAAHDWGLFWCMTIVGGIVDEPDLPKEEKLICPQELVDMWKLCRIDGEPLIDESVKILNEGTIKKMSLISPLIVSILVLILAIITFFLRVPYMDWLFLGGQTLLGCLMLWLWLSPLPATGWSWLIIPFNPLPAICWQWRKYWALPWAIVLIGWCAVMTGEFFWGHVLVDWPHIILVLAFTIVLLKQYKSARA